MIYGPEGCGKSTTLYLTIAQAQKKYPDKIAYLCDPEQNYDVAWATSCGVDPNRLEVHQPESCEEAVDLVEAFSYVVDVSFIGMDSIAALFTKAEVEESVEDKHVAERARLLSVLYSKLLGSWSKERKRGHRVTCLFLNQFREKIGVMFGDPRTLPGGKAINYYFPRLKIELLKQKKKYIKSDETGLEIPDYNETRFKLAKEKGSTIPEGEFQINLNPENLNGVLPGQTDDYAVVVAYSRRWGYITGGGKSWRIDEVDKTFGKQAEIIEYLVESPEEFTRLKQLCIMSQREAVGLPPLPTDGYLYGYIDLED